MKIEVFHYFVEKAVKVRHPGDILEVSPEEGERLIERGIAKSVKPPKRKEKE